MAGLALATEVAVAQPRKYVHHATATWCITSNLPCAALLREDVEVLDRLLPGALGRYIYPADAAIHRHDGAPMGGAEWREWDTWTRPAACQLCGVAVERGDKGLRCGARGHQLCWGCVVLGVPWTAIVRDELSRGQPLRCIYVSRGVLSSPCTQPQSEAESEAEAEAEEEDYWSRAEPTTPPAASKAVEAAAFANRTAAVAVPPPPLPPPPPPPRSAAGVCVASPWLASLRPMSKRSKLSEAPIVYTCSQPVKLFLRAEAMILYAFSGTGSKASASAQDAAAASEYIPMLPPTSISSGVLIGSGIRLRSHPLLSAPWC